MNKKEMHARLLSILGEINDIAKKYDCLVSMSADVPHTQFDQQTQPLGFVSGVHVELLPKYDMFRATTLESLED